ncbi:PREDICTED: PIH1 domain-containing protein 1 [Nicrophorus vespilloides]|uniref:PIH1 domain-containing protein 1 n=1 Tax=Nicrophorus vespilloides TaxID=110193 RepID=A0ABM1N678_NICVS|nr:PREDICTED: PIH1 domain-containing protein 1 [Nicrophorus vespilloides]
MARKSVFLDVDSSLRERNYLLAKDPAEDEMEKFFSQAAADRQIQQPKLVKPSPGMCLKTKDVKTGKKMFMNICVTEEIPAPKDISETELERIVSSEEMSDFRVPMSIGEIHVEQDNKGSKVDVCDIAVNTKFFKKIQTMRSFKEIFLAIVLEGVQEKYSLTLDNEMIILKNKKSMGTLQVHRLRPMEMKEKMGEKTQTQNKLPSLTNILPQEQNKRKLIEAISSPDRQEPKYRLLQKKDNQFVLYAEIYLPYIISHEEISLSIGEDRLILDSNYYFLDIFMDNVDRDRCISIFNKINKFLTITMVHKDAPKVAKTEQIENAKSQPEYRLYRKPEDSTHLYLAVSLPKIKSANDINLELGMDEVRMETPNYFLNLFVDFEIDADRSTNNFDDSQKLLTVTMTHLKAQKSP